MEFCYLPVTLHAYICCIIFFQAIHAVYQSPKKEELIVQNNPGKSYEISPYQSSDDEDEEDDELPTKKYIPSWARCLLNPLINILHNYSDHEISWKNKLLTTSML